MKSQYGDLSDRYLVLIKIDATNLFNRINLRQDDYIETFSLKRNRAIFKEIFENRYQKTTIFDLAHLPIEVIEVVNVFYQHVDEVFWYLKNTQDMPNTIQDTIIRKIAHLSRDYNNLCLFIDGSLSGKSIEEILESTISDFETEGEHEDTEKTTELIQDEVYFDAE